ncbi:FMN-binding protein [Ferrigenium sp. UT5]|uniref:FMN-binding protein n=1 Tax=Ferrigenium sp. UT5 TaxID=3242105 RepID=UPI003552E1ED
MSETDKLAPPPADITPGTRLVATLGLVTTLCGALIVAVWQLTLPAIAANKKIVLERAVRALVPDAARIVDFDATPAGLQRAGQTQVSGAVRFHAAYNAAGELQAIAAEGGARGYADTVRVLYGYRPACECIFGIRVIQMKETPGIGDNVASDADFLANFDSLDLTLAEDGQGLAHAVRAVKHGTKRFAWEIDAISGATISSKAIGRGINDSAQRLLPLLLPRLEQVKSEGAAK